MRQKESWEDDKFKKEREGREAEQPNPAMAESKGLMALSKVMSSANMSLGRNRRDLPQWQKWKASQGCEGQEDPSPAPRLSSLKTTLPPPPSAHAMAKSPAAGLGTFIQIYDHEWKSTEHPEPEGSRTAAGTNQVGQDCPQAMGTSKGQADGCAPGSPGAKKGMNLW